MENVITGQKDKKNTACNCGYHSHGEDVCGCSGHHHGEEACGCGHQHSEEKSSSHHSEEACGCGHHHEVAEGCGCEHHDEEAEEAEEEPSAIAGKKKIYILENLGCANCAAKMERKIMELEQVEYANIVFTTKQLQIVTNTEQELLPTLQKICASIEAEVVVTKREQTKKKDTSGKTELQKESRKDFWELGLGVVLLFAGGFAGRINGTAELIVLLAGYLVLGRGVLLTAVRNIGKGNIFDENFLMSIATLGAFIIGDYKEAVGIMLFYRVGELFEKVAVEKSRSQIMDAVDMRPEVVSRIEEDTVTVIPAEQANVGDIIVVRPGDRIPLDGTVEYGESRLDTSPLTGEPVPVSVKSGDSVVSGCVNTSGKLHVRVDKVLEDSMVTRILDSVENAAASKPKITRFITRFSRIYTPFVVALALVTAVVPSLVTGNWNYWVYTAITFLVISCPCALVLSVPLAFFSGIGAGSKHGILFKGGVAIEALQGIKAIVMDKTGTITQGNFVLQNIFPANGTRQEELIALAAACEKSSSHPIAVSIVAAAAEKELEIQSVDQVEEISGKGVSAVIGGKNVLCGNRRLMELFEVNLEQYENRAYGTEVLLAVDGIYAGQLLIADTIKKDAKSAISALSKLGIRTAMLTGDAVDTAEKVAQETGIDEVHAKLLPEDKVKELKNIREKYGSVMFVGDGINDAPVLAGADVGAAMGSGADAAIEAADVLFMTSAMEAIPQALRIAKTTGRIAKQNVTLALVVKILFLALGLLGFSNMWLAVFADTGVAMLCILNAIRAMK